MSDEPKPDAGIYVSITGSTISGQVAVGNSNTQVSGTPPALSVVPAETSLAPLPLLDLPPITTLSGPQRHQLRDALVSAFPSVQALAEMVSFGLDENLSALTTADGLNAAAFGLVEWARGQGRLDELVRVAYQANSGNPALRAFVAQLAPAAPPL
jgi:hypothetical protein